MDAELVALSEAIAERALAPSRHPQRRGERSLLDRPAAQGPHQSRLFIATAESCTGGWAAQVITHTAGSSQWFDRGFVTYANAAKVEMLGVRPETLEKHGAVSEQAAAEMAIGALENSNALISLAITGIAGPAGGSPGKPVGTVIFAWCIKGQAPETEHCLFSGNRETIRRMAVVHALKGLVVRARSMP